MSDPKPVLTLSGVCKAFPGAATAVLDNLELQLWPGEYLAIMGESGAGKSTLLNLIAGLETPDAGRIVFDGVELQRLNDDQLTRLRRERIGFIFQAFHLLAFLTALQNVMLPLELLGVSSHERHRRAQALLDACGIGELSARFPRELSGGELQRVAVARALAHRPRLVLADEPTGNLDARSAAVVLQLLREQLHAQRAAGILITHSWTAAQSADRVLRLAGGRLQVLSSEPASA